MRVMEKKPLRIDEYICIGSTDYAGEFQSKSIWISAFPRDMGYWRSRASKENLEHLGLFLSGMPMLEADNTLIIEVPKFMADDAEEKKRMVEAAFGIGNGGQILFTLPTEVNGLKIHIAVDPKSVSVSDGGRTVKICFNTEITLLEPFSGIPAEELKRGFFYSNKNDRFFRVLRVLTEAPDSLDFCRKQIYGNYTEFGLTQEDADCDFFVIQKSADSVVARRKLLLEHYPHLIMDVKPLLRLAKVFGYSKAADDDSDYRGFFSKRGSFGYFGNVPGTTYGLMRRRSETSLKDFAEQAKNDSIALRKCLQQIESIEEEMATLLKVDYPKWCSMTKQLKTLKETHMDAVVHLRIRYEDFMNDRRVKSLKQQMTQDIEELDSVWRFVTEKLVPQVKPGEATYDTICRYVYGQISMDPLMFCDSSTGPFQSFARSLLV